MLSKLSINNLAIIENATVSFKDGFTVLSGESGAGKSLLIDSLSLLLGSRASVELIRSGEEKASIEGTFIVSSKRLSSLLSSFDIPFLEDTLVIERVISKGKSAIKANGVAISLATLLKIAPLLADIHSQYDTIKLLNPENYLSIIDGYSFEATSKLKGDYLLLKEAYLEKKKELENLLLDKKKLEENRDFLTYQYKELSGANLSLEEEGNLEAEIDLLRNYDKVYSLSMETKALIESDFLDTLYEIDKLAKKLLPYRPDIKDFATSIDEKYYEISDALGELNKSLSDIDFDPNRLDELEQRSADLQGLKRKYKKDIPSLIEYYESLKSMLGEENGIEERIERKQKEVDEAFSQALEKGKELSFLRHSIAKTIEKEAKSNLEDLLLKSAFEIIFAPDANELKDNGIDEVDFLIETNLGEGLKPLSKVISGGEASRIMLAFKAIFIKSNRIGTVIFDEIDAGISGLSALAVARKIKEISYDTQVIAISHLPQVASRSDNMVLIQKKEKGGRTSVIIHPLNLEQKIEEVAHLISGETLTKASLDYAKEMVIEANSEK